MGRITFFDLAWKTLGLVLFFSFLTALMIGCGSGECRFDADCTGNKVCQQGKCSSNILKPSCTKDSECQAGEICDKEACIAATCKTGEKKPCYEGSQGTEGIGLCKAGQKTCQGGQWSWCEGQILPTTEICDTLDNDCNGQIDDNPNCTSTCTAGQTRPCYTGPAGTQGVGVCVPGTETCNNGAWAGCVGDIRPEAQEKCDDGLDNNCNGQIDEGCGACTAGQTRPCYTGPAPTRNVGTCKLGTQACNAGVWGTCTGEVIPQTETCGDNLDNDCNGKVDDAAGCTATCTDGQSRPCYSGPAGTKGIGICKEGLETCQGAAWGPCVGEVTPQVSENCNDQLDNNCNGQVNESCGVCKGSDQDICYTGTSGCTKQADGSYACNSPCKSGIRTCQGGQWGPCQGEAVPALSDTCGDNLDNNCNGQIDEGCGVCTNGQSRACYNGPAGTKGVGTCKEGTETCLNGQWGLCQGQVGPLAEVCSDGKDNDCNGQVDDGCSQPQGKLHQPCTTDTDCDAGQFCVNTGSGGLCFQQCTGTPGVCATNTDGRTSCRPFARDQQGNSYSICAKIIATNAACNTNLSQLCDETKDLCTNGLCKPVTFVQTGRTCDGQASPPTVCNSTDTCVGFGTGFPGVCLKSCTAAAQCSSTFECISLGSGQGACLQRNCTATSQCQYPSHDCVPPNASGVRYCYPKQLTGPAGYASVCNVGDPAKRCQAGLFCISVQGGTDGICTANCTANCTSFSPAGAQCVEIYANAPDQKACLFLCSTNGDCPSGRGLVCNTQIGGACFPP